MKLRLHKNELRLRLSQSEVTLLAGGGQVGEEIGFPNDQTLSYELESGDRSDVVALFENDGIRIILPAAAVKLWAETNETGIEGMSGSLRILVEKDFQCLHRDAKQNADAFPNPLAQG